jgi:hypothetical protein
MFDIIDRVLGKIRDVFALLDAECLALGEAPAFEALDDLGFVALIGG